MSRYVPAPRWFIVCASRAASLSAAPAVCSTLQCGVDGKVIKAASVSVQTNQTYEQQFALEMEKAKARPSCSACIFGPVLRNRCPHVYVPVWCRKAR